jgi:ribonucleoside-diphosphate reductase alpha chain
MGFGHSRVLSLPDGVAQALNDYLEEGTPGNESEEAYTATDSKENQMSLFEAVGDLCPVCGQATMIYTEGCRRCYTCGHSEC